MLINGHLPSILKTPVFKTPTLVSCYSQHWTDSYLAYIMEYLHPFRNQQFRTYHIYFYRVHNILYSHSKHNFLVQASFIDKI